MVRVYGLSSGESGTVHVWYRPPTAWLIAQGASVLGALLLAASLRRMRSAHDGAARKRPAGGGIQPA
ncbi:MAG: hypothetical protein ACLUI3_01235 [Christensenellales bacterium]